MTRFTLTASKDGVAALKAAAAFAGKDKGRPVLQCLDFLRDYAVATDSYAVGLVPTGEHGDLLHWTGHPEPVPPEYGLLVNAKDIKRVLTQVKLDDRSGEYAALVFDTDEQKVTVIGGGVETKLPLEDGSFPDIPALLPVDDLRSRRYDLGGALPTVDLKHVQKFTKLSESVSQELPTTAVRMLPADPSVEGWYLKPVAVYTLGHRLLGLVMPVRDDDRIAAQP